MGEMVRVRFMLDADLPDYIDLVKGTVYTMEDISETHYLWCGVHHFCKWRFDVVGKDEEKGLEEEVANMLPAYRYEDALFLATKIIQMVRKVPKKEEVG